MIERIEDIRDRRLDYYSKLTDAQLKGLEAHALREAFAGGWRR